MKLNVKILKLNVKKEVMLFSSRQNFQSMDTISCFYIVCEETRCHDRLIHDHG